jgi:hypothetical protein
MINTTTATATERGYEDSLAAKYKGSMHRSKEVGRYLRV